MRGSLFRLIHDYQRCVARAVDLLEASGIARPRSSAEWAARDLPARGPLATGFKYYKQGSGCAVAGREWSVEFAFGDNGEIDGFDAWRLHHFANTKLPSYGFASSEEVERAVVDAAARGTLRRAGDALYYLVPDDTTDPTLVTPRS